MISQKIFREKFLESYESGFFTKCIFLVKEIKDKNEIESDLHFLIGRSFLAVDEPKLALEYFLKHLEEYGPNGFLYRAISACFTKLRKYNQALNYLEKASQTSPNNDSDYIGMFYLSALLFDFKKREHFKKIVLDNISKGHIINDPFPILLLSDSATLVRYCNQVFSEIQNLTTTEPTPTMISRHENKTIKIAYISSDFYSHATTFLIRDLILNHDRNLFKIYAIDFSRDDNSNFRSQILSAFDQVIAIHDLSDEDSAKAIASENIDILIDLKGFTEGSRPGIFKFRPAPVQVSYLGYPATSGSNLFDYFIGDKVTIPQIEDSWFSEQIVRLDCCYQPNTKTSLKQSARTRPTNLPSDTFIFCNFNNLAKASFETLDAWRTILDLCSNSVFWTISPPDERQFLGQLEELGFDGSRVILGQSVSREVHLSRIAFADLALDTFPCGGHTTTSDLLSQSVPVITLPGEAFHSRVSASLLTYCGCSELIARSWSHYVAMACRLYSDKDLLARYKSILSNQGPNSPFNPSVTAKNLEEAFKKMMELERPAHIDL